MAVIGKSLLFIFCVHACYTDLRKRQIKNLTSFGLIYVGILLLGISIIEGNQPWTQAFLSVIVAVVLCIASYSMGVVGAGDAKFYVGLALSISAIIPTRIAQTAQLLPIALIINTLIIYLLSVVLLVVVTLPYNLKFFRESFLNQVSSVVSLKQQGGRILLLKVSTWLLGILLFLATFHTIQWGLLWLGHSDRLLALVLSIIAAYGLNNLMKKWHVNDLWKAFLTILWITHLLLNVKTASLSLKSVLTSVGTIAVFVLVYQTIEWVLKTLSEKIYRKIEYPTLDASPIHIRFAPFLCLGGLITLLAEGTFYEFFV